MGLDSADPRFMAVHKEDINPAVVDNEEPTILIVEDGAQMIVGEEMIEMIEILD